MGPCFTAVHGFIDAVAHGVGACIGPFAGSDPDNIGIGWGNGHGPGGNGALVVEYGFESGAVIDCFPDTAAGGGDI